MFGEDTFVYGEDTFVFGKDTFVYGENILGRSRASASPFAGAFICREALKSIGGGCVAWA